MSVIVPVYNAAPYLDKCVESICAQTYRDLEIILIDDGSSDGSGEICDQWRTKDARIRVIHQKNSGVSSARNVGLSICTGDVVSFADSDDWLDTDMIRKLMACLTENEASAAMCGFVDYPHGAPVKKGVFQAPVGGYSAAAYQMMRRNGYFTSLWAKLFRRELIFRGDAFRRFDPTLSLGEDEVWLLQVLQPCERVAFLPEALYYWRPTEGSITRSVVVTKRQRSIMAAKEKTLTLLPDDRRVRRLARGRMYNDCFFLIALSYCSGDTETLRTVRRELKPMFWDWLCSPNVILLRKCKLLTLNLEIRCGMPAAIVRKTFGMTHQKD